MLSGLRQTLLIMLAAAVLSACNGGESSDENSGVDNNSTTYQVPKSEIILPDAYADYFRFLNQATMGATETEIGRVAAVGYEAWIDEQMAMPISLSAPYVEANLSSAGDVRVGSRNGAWVKNALQGRDQLRQRVALALSEILVISETGGLSWFQWELAMADYYDLLAKNAFGNYRNLLQDVTLHPAMGTYLSMRGNLKPDTEKNIRPDENFARELMQLFTIGLVELNIDGTPKRDSRGHTIPTYTQDTVQGFAHVFTGWDYKKIVDDPPAPILPTHISRRKPMALSPERHDIGPKELLGGVTLPARNDGEQDLQDALDNIFEHQNVGPFVSLRLIQRLVTSNPSPDYVARIARVFNGNGSGVKGDLAAVVKAILLDPEARPDSYSPIDGKLKEPMLKLTQLWRAYDAVKADSSGDLLVPDMTEKTGQGPLQAESVFNFFLPSYAPRGEIRDQQLVAPEMQIITDYLSAEYITYVYRQTHYWNQFPELDVGGHEATPHVLINFNSEIALEANPDELIDRLAYKMLGGNISAELRAHTADVIDMTKLDKEGHRTAAAIFIIASSPEYAYQN
jgi:uncharacterized protein (DUF1800 family)